MVRRGTARLTVNPPNLRVRGGPDQATRDKIAALFYFQWDKSQQQRVLRQNVHQCKAFGWSVSKVYWDKVVAVRKLWRFTHQLNREQLLKLKGAPADEVDGQVNELGPDLSMGEVAGAISQFGDKVQCDVECNRYEGPVGARIFLGDIFVEPGFRNINQSNYVIEYSERDVRYLKYWSRQKTINPYTGQEQPVCDPQALQDLIDRGGRSLTYQRDMDLRRQLRLAINQSDPRTNFDPRLRGPRYSILERHTRDDSGYIVVDLVGDEAVHIGRMWYPWNTYGRYIYSELVLIPDLLGGIGDSPARVSRFLMQLRNARMNQTTDYINNVLRPNYTLLDTADITEESFNRTAWGNTLRVQQHSDVAPMQMHQLPSSAWEDQAQLVREMQLVAPEITDFGPGTSESPQSGKFATTAVLQKQATDVVMADELAQLDQFIADDLELRLWMTQQAMTDAVDIPPGTSQRIDALSARMTDGQIATIRVDQMDVQEDFQILPETGSTLAADDAYKRQHIERFYQLALQNPEILNVRSAAEKLVSTIPGLSPQEAIVPPVETPPQPPVKVNVSIAIKWPELPGDVQKALLSAAQLPTDGIAGKQMLQHVGEVADAADAASRMAQPDVPPEQDQEQVGADQG